MRKVEAVGCGLIGAFCVACGDAGELWNENAGSDTAEIVVSGRPFLQEQPEEFLGGAVAMGDFNDDGLDDFAMGVPGEIVAGNAYAGAVLIRHGHASGVGFIRFVTENTNGLPNVAESGDFFGAALAAGDFNGDGKDDLAVGAADEERVFVIYAAADGSGLTASGSQELTQSSVGFIGSGSQFGASLAAGDFNGDTKDDLAIGFPLANIGDPAEVPVPIYEAGMVFVTPGSATGLVPGSSVQLHQGGPFDGTAELFDCFGTSVAAGDFNADGFDDIVVGVPEEGLGGTDSVGAIQVWLGSVNLIAGPGLVFHQSTAGIDGTAERLDRFGSSVTTGRFNGDLFDDIAVGVPGEDIGTVADAGMVNLIFGSATGPVAAGNYGLHQDSADVAGVAAPGNRFGAALTRGHFNQDAMDDLGIGAPGDQGCGSAYVFLGSASGPNGSTDSMWFQNTTDVLETCESGDNFGASLASGDFNGDGFDDLGVGVPNEDVGTVPEAGAAQILKGSSTGITAQANLLFTE